MRAQPDLIPDPVQWPASTCAVTPFRWIAEYQSLNGCPHSEAHAAWRRTARQQLREVIGHLDAANWQDVVDALPDDTVAECLQRVSAVLRMGFRV